MMANEIPELDVPVSSDFVLRKFLSIPVLLAAESFSFARLCFGNRDGF